MKFIKNASIFTGEEMLTKASIVWGKNKITYIGSNKEKLTGTEIKLGKDLIITPALINPYAKAGLKEFYLDRVSGDDNLDITKPMIPHYNVIPGINYSDEIFQKLFEQGFLTLAISPGDKNVISGNLAIINSSGETIEEMIIKDDIGLKATLGARLKGIENASYPKTRVAVVALLRQAFYNALEYYKNKYEKMENVPIDLFNESLLNLLKRNKKVFIHANRADDIATAIRLKKEFNLDMVIVGCSEAYKIVEKLKEENISCIVTLNSKYIDDREVMDMSHNSLRILIDEGLCVSMSSDYTLSDTSLLDSINLIIKNGFSEAEVVKLLTINASRILGIDSFSGSLKAGKNANFLVFRNKIFNNRADYIVKEGHAFDSEGDF